MSNLDKFKTAKKLYNFEGDRGIKNIEVILNEIGYREDGFAHGSALENFFKDNPGAYEGLLEFIEEHFDDQFGNEEEGDEE